MFPSLQYLVLNDNQIAQVRVSSEHVQDIITYFYSQNAVCRLLLLRSILS